MEITVEIFLTLMTFAFICEFIDASLGMGYGTILSPLLIIMGFSPTLVIPAVLISQAFGGFFAAIFHRQLGNINFKSNPRDLKLVILISVLGIFATVLAAVIAINIPKNILKSYIGLMVLVMGIIILKNKAFTFSWNKMIGIGILSAFNKGMSGGGFGPVVTGGQILAGQEHKSAVGITTMAEAPICISGFFTYLVVSTIKNIPGPVLDIPFKDFISQMFSIQLIQWELILALMLGSIIVAPFAAFTTRSIKKKGIHYIIGILITVLGVWTLYKTWF
jgi:uncharacterized membrane protein YfcA